MKNVVRTLGAAVVAFALIGLPSVASATPEPPPPVEPPVAQPEPPPVPEPEPAQPEPVEPPSARQFTKIYGTDCTEEHQAKVTMWLVVRDDERQRVSYEASNGSTGKLSAGGNPWKFDVDRERLRFVEDAGGGTVTVTFDGRSATVRTDCEENETSTPPTSTTTTTTTTTPPTSETTTTTPAPVGNVVNPLPTDVGGKVESEDLAYTGTSDALPIAVLIGLGLLACGLVLVLLFRRRSGDSGSHRS